MPVDKKVEKFLDLARKRLAREVKADSENRTAAISCLNFLLPENQWEPQDRADRKNDGRPCLTLPMLPKFVNQVVGDMLHSRARVSIKPVDAKADPHIAKIRQGIIANVEYNSNAEDIYLEAGKMQVASGYGAWRVNTRWCEDDPFLQEIYLESVPNPFNVYLDSRRKDPAGADAKYGFIISKMPRTEFEEEYPKATIPADGDLKIGAGMKDELWYAKDTVTVAEYFVVEPKKQTMLQLDDGTVMSEKAYAEMEAAWETQREKQVEKIQGMLAEPEAPPVPAPPQGQPPAPGGMALPPQNSPMPMQPQAPPAPTALPASASPQAPPPPNAQPQTVPGVMALQPKGGASLPPLPKVVKRRETEISTIRHYVITGNEILSDNGVDGEEFPGRYIPIILITGPTLNVEGKVHIKGLIKDARDAQRMVNYWETILAETIALAPKAPWVGTAKQFEGQEEMYRQANVKNFPFLTYNVDIAENSQIVPMPQRQSPQQPPIALFTQAQRAQENLKSVIGMFGTDVGEVGPERTGAAVDAKQRPGDISTFVFAYNLNRGIEHSGKIINEMIPTIYDSERDARLRNVDDTEHNVPINTTAENALKAIRANPERYRGFNLLRLTEIIQRHGKGAKFNDITVGKYDVVVTIGANYATQRQETARTLQGMTQAMPQEMAKVADIMFENMDFKDADRIAARLRKSMPPGFAELKEGEQPFVPPPAPAVQVQLMKVKTEQAKEVTQQLKSKVEMVRLYKETQETETEIRAQILKALAELAAPHHPADEQLLIGM